MALLRKAFLMALLPVAIVIGDAAIKSSAFAAEKLFFQGDMVRGVPKTGPTGPVCVLASQFRHKEMVVWRIRVYDPDKSQQLGKASLKSIVVELPNGKHFNMRYGTHPPKHPSDTYWTAAWVIPESYPTGTFAYKVVATDMAGKTHTWEPFTIKSSQFTVVAAKMMKK